MMPLPIPTNPLPDESLLGFIVRACDSNGHPDVAHNLRLAGLNTLRARFTPANGLSNINDIASYCGCNAELLRPRFSNPVDVDGVPRSFLNFHGHPIRAHLREPVLRRVSPISLRNSQHHRAIWLLRPLHYCPESGEKLISHCPNPMCGRALGWERAYGVGFCEHCIDRDSEPTTDLRDHEQPTLIGDELDTYSKIAGLVAASNPQRNGIPTCFVDWQNWEIFDLVVMLAVFLCVPIGSRRAPCNLFSMDNWHTSFMTAATAVLNWPLGMDAVVQHLRQSAHVRDGFYGRFKDIGPLSDCGRIYGALPKAVDEIENALSSFYGPEGKFKKGKGYEHEGNRISFRGARARHGINSGLLSAIVKNKSVDILRASEAEHAPVYFNETELLKVIETRKALIPLKRLVGTTGFPMFVIEGLVNSGHIKLVDGAVSLRRDKAVLPSEVERLDSRIRAGAKDAPAAGAVTILAAVRVTCVGGDKLPALVAACLDGRLEFSFADRAGTTFTRLMVVASDVRDLVGDQRLAMATLPKMSARDVSLYLDVLDEDVAGLIRCGLLRAANPDGKQWVDGASVQEFAEKLLSSSAVAHRLGISIRSVAKVMAARGIKPFREFVSVNKTPAFAWRRSDLEQT